MTIALGPFQLIKPIGKGGMGVVWQAVHAASGTAVAVKVITQRVSKDERTLRAFENEVRAVAALRHPGIVWVEDYGEVDEAAAIASDHQLMRGSPYLVMELASGGTLTMPEEGMPWPVLKRTLISLLDALAHAHARGVIHRDLKPGNVLVSGPGDTRPGLKLTDFGIAHAREETVSHSMSNHVIGTLHYMGPEQIRADWRDYGPWTDLYALGTIAYKLASGVLPFKGKRGASLMVAQLNHRPPTLVPLQPVPDGFENWLLTAMRKEHWRRFQCAADAAMALEALGEPAIRAGYSPAPGQSFSLDADGLSMGLDDHPTTLILEPDTLELGVSAEPTDELSLSSFGASTFQRTATPGELDRVRPPIPPNWRRRSAGAPPKLEGAGLGLWGLRDLAIVGRETERDAIWAALREVGDSRRASLVLLEGPAGCGKTTVATWIVQRAVEIGAAHVLHLTYGADEEPDEGIRRMLRRFFRVARLDPEQRAQRVLDVCDTFGETDAAQARRVEALLDPVDARAEGGGRHGALRWMLGRVASDRPLILWVDDAHHGMDALKLIGSMLKAGAAPTRVLFLLGVTDGLVGDQPVEADFLASLQAHERARTVRLEPLGPDAMHELVRDRLGLGEALTATVIAAAEGNPQDAVQLVGDWVQRDSLVRGPDGFRLAQGAQLPGSASDAWSSRIERLLEGLGEHAGPLLERAAVLGNEVEDEEWVAVTEAMGIGDREASMLHRHLRDRLLTRSFAMPQEFGFTFANDAVRDALLQRATEGGRIVGHHLAVAAMLGAREEPVPERLGTHLLAAGELNRAVEALMLGIRRRVASVGPRAALPLVDSLERALGAAGLPEDDPRWGELWLVRADLAVQRGRLAEGHRWAGQLEDRAAGMNWRDLRGLAVFTQARVALFRKELSAAQLAFARFETIGIAETFALHLAASRYSRSLLAEAEGRLVETRQHAVASTQWLQQTESSLVDIWRVLGLKGLLRAHQAAVHANLERIGDLYETPGKLSGLAEAWSSVARALRRSRDHAGSIAALRRAVRLYGQAQDPMLQEARLQLALLCFAQSGFVEASELAAEVSVSAAASHRKPLALRAAAIQAAVAAATDDWTSMATQLEVTLRLFGDTGAAEKEVGWALARAGDLAFRVKRSALATRAWEQSLQHFGRLGDEGQVRRLQTLLARSTSRLEAGPVVPG